MMNLGVFHATTQSRGFSIRRKLIFWSIHVCAGDLFSGNNRLACDASKPIYWGTKLCRHCGLLGNLTPDAGWRVGFSWLSGCDCFQWSDKNRHSVACKCLRVWWDVPHRKNGVCGVENRKIQTLKSVQTAILLGSWLEAEKMGNVRTDEENSHTWRRDMGKWIKWKRAPIALFWSPNLNIEKPNRVNHAKTQAKLLSGKRRSNSIHNSFSGVNIQIAWASILILQISRDEWAWNSRGVRASLKTEFLPLHFKELWIVENHRIWGFG